MFDGVTFYLFRKNAGGGIIKYLVLYLASPTWNSLMVSSDFPSLEAFLAAPPEVVAQVAPAAMAYAPGGTRRQATFNGLSPWSDAYFRWARQATIACFDLIFQNGVRHLFSPTLTPGNFAEANAYRPRLLQWVEWGIAGPEALHNYARHGWRVRLIGGEHVPELQNAAARLITDTPVTSAHTLWWTVMPTPEAAWESLLHAAQQSKTTSRADLMYTLYGEELPLITLYLAFGKPQFSSGVLPPLLLGDMQCYWSQQPGYSLTTEQFRTILYDFAFLRQTWTQDKTGRAEAAAPYRAVWQRPLILGLGQRLGRHWYPAEMPLPPDANLPDN